MCDRDNIIGWTLSVRQDLVLKRLGLKMADLVYVAMVGDVIHPGNLNVINKAKEYGDVMVGLMTDAAVAEHEQLPYLTYEQREIIVSNIKGVSKVVSQSTWSGVENLRKFKPKYGVHGDDWKFGSKSIAREAVFEEMKKLGGEVIEIPFTQGINTPAIDTVRREFGATPELRMKALRRLILAKPIVRIMEIHSGISGLIVENISIDKKDGIHVFDGMWSSSLTDSTSKGKPDIEAVDLTTRLQELSNVLECTTKPVIYDGDTGG